jgi:hypothetical protein
MAATSRGEHSGNICAMHSVSQPVPASPGQSWPEQAKRAVRRHPGRWPAVIEMALSGLLIRGFGVRVPGGAPVDVQILIALLSCPAA